jgi:hypothetical protein
METLWMFTFWSTATNRDAGSAAAGHQSYRVLPMKDITITEHLGCGQRGLKWADPHAELRHVAI